MSETTNPNLSAVAETLLLPLYNRAMESQRPDAMLKDEKAVALVTQMRSDVAIRYAFDQVRQIPMTEKAVWQFKEVVRLPARLILEVDDADGDVTVAHTIRAGFRGLGRILDPLLRLYLSDEFERAMDEHAQAEFPMLGAMLSNNVRSKA